MTTEKTFSASLETETRAVYFVHYHFISRIAGKSPCIHKQFGTWQEADACVVALPELCEELMQISASNGFVDEISAIYDVTRVFLQIDKFPPNNRSFKAN